MTHDVHHHIYLPTDRRGGSCNNCKQDDALTTTPPPKPILLSLKSCVPSNPGIYFPLQPWPRVCCNNSYCISPSADYPRLVPRSQRGIQFGIYYLYQPLNQYIISAQSSLGQTVLYNLGRACTYQCSKSSRWMYLAIATASHDINSHQCFTDNGSPTQIYIIQIRSTYPSW